MTNISWPESLPQPKISGLEGKYNKAFIRTEMDSGPAKQRRRFTAVAKSVSGAIILDSSQLEIFESFFQNSLSYGTLRFVMKDPQNGAPAEFRFTDMYTSTGTENGLWEVALPLERLSK